MLRTVKIILIGVSILAFAGSFDSLASAAEDALKRPVNAPALSQERRVADTLRQLGFAVESVKNLGKGNWEVRVGGFDAQRARGAFRGAVAAPAALAGGSRNRAAAGEAGIAGRGGATGPRGGGARSDQDGSATGGGNSGPEGSSGGGRDGGPLPGSDNPDGGSATGGGNDGGPGQGTNPRGLSSALRVSIMADGTLVVNAASLRKAGFANTVGTTTNGQVTFR